jgi:hypothetical protein
MTCPIDPPTKGEALKTRYALALAAIVSAVPSVATAAPPEGSLHLTLVSASEGQLGPQSFFFTDTIYQGGKAAGTSRAVCRFTGRFENPRCRITLSLRGGKLVLFVRLTPDPRGHFKVTAGSGRYQGKAGVGIYRSSNTTTKLTIWLTS